MQSYSKDLHEALNDVKLARERLELQMKMVSENQVELRAHYKK